MPCKGGPLFMGAGGAEEEPPPAREVCGDAGLEFDPERCCPPTGDAGRLLLPDRADGAVAGRLLRSEPSGAPSRSALARTGPPDLKAPMPGGRGPPPMGPPPGGGVVLPEEAPGGAPGAEALPGPDRTPPIERPWYPGYPPPMDDDMDPRFPELAAAG
mmetsp:Transcript_52356/g.132991  ORF Transcript_52356/g.132991 Transcript_52356/m.132991 type:complete len:158 (+) Transcript_52356:250-723(+)